MKLAERAAAPTPVKEEVRPPISAPEEPASRAEPRQLDLPVDRPVREPLDRRTAASAARHQAARLGSKVRLRYLDLGQETYQFTIVKDSSAPERGLVNQNAPLAKAVLDAEAGDELEILLGSTIRKAVVESVI
ncbi:GreA/GreB family elongation factor [Rhizobium sp. 22-785-1]